MVRNMHLASYSKTDIKFDKYYLKCRQHYKHLLNYIQLSAITATMPLASRVRGRKIV